MTTQKQKREFLTSVKNALEDSQTLALLGIASQDDIEIIHSALVECLRGDRSLHLLHNSKLNQISFRVDEYFVHVSPEALRIDCDAV
jgi:hypothetical protein